MQLWTSFLISLCFGFLIYKVGTIVAPVSIELLEFSEKKHVNHFSSGK